jgi:hypothetical protein
MTSDELNAYLEVNQMVEWAEDGEGNLYFRHKLLDRGDEKVKVEKNVINKLTPALLEKVLVGGRNIEHITRITGYFSKVASWNKGKKAELADRQKVLVS